MRTLLEKRAGRVARLGIRGPLMRRLTEMGATPGTYIEIIRVSPLGDPVQVALRGYTLTLRREDAVNISVEKIDGEEVTP